MFNKEYSFKGVHAEKVKHLTTDFDKQGNKLFKRNFDVYLLAPIVGFLYQNKAPVDKGEVETKIFADILIKHQIDLWFNYRLIMLLDTKHEPDIEKRINKAFRTYDKPEARLDEELFEEYVRGGVDKIYEKLMENAVSSDNYLMNLYDFVEEVHERYNSQITTDNILDLCRLVSSE